MFTSLSVCEIIEDWVIMTAYGRFVAKNTRKGVVAIPLPESIAVGQSLSTIQ